MGEAFAWIGQLIQWIASFLPHLIHCPATHRGVMFRGAKTKVMKPGIHIYFPFYSQPTLYPVKRQTIKLPSQTLSAWDTETEVVSILITTIVTFEVEDIHKALVDTYEFEETITETAQGIVKKVLFGKTWSEIIQDQDAIDKEMSVKIRAVLKRYGVRVIESRIIDLAETKVYRVVGDGKSDHTQPIIVE